ncbi:MAG: glycosyltransferase family 2 protein [Planctomycetia bacterium]|nr:glycosyltransferase family 2 protein [Planctomycetia bacterium]
MIDTAPLSATEVGLPYLSILMPVRNEGRHIANTLGGLLSQDYPTDRYEVLIADGRSTDDTRNIVAAMATPNVRVLDNPGLLSSAGRNAAVRAARGDILVLVDGHCDLGGPNYLREIASAFARSGADCVGRPQPLDVSGATSLQRAIAAARGCRLGHHPSSHIWAKHEGFVPPHSVAVAYQREVFERVGMFDERFDACEDYEFNTRVASAGMSCFLTPQVTVHYTPRDSLLRLYRQMIRYGRGRIRLLRKHPGTFSPAVFVPAMFLLGLMVGPVIALLLPILWLVYGACVGLYLFLVLGYTFTLAFRDLRTLPWLPPVFFAIHGGAAIGVLLELVFGPPGKEA